MKKKCFIFLCVLALVVSIGAVTAQAEGFETCPCCNRAYADCNWQPWTLSNGGEANTLLTDGHYYLTGDVPGVTTQIRIGNGTATPSVTIDLRGFSITSSVRAFGVYPGSTLSIVDSVGGGQIKGRQVSENQVGGVIRVNEGATFNLYGGEVLDVATAAHAANGAAISTEGKNVSINFYGGAVTGSAFAPNGGAIYAARGATVTVAGSEINGGSAFNGGAIYLDNATLNVTGGTVGGGTATRENAEEGAVAGNGGAIYAGNGSVVNISGGTVTGGTAVNGGAIALMSSTLSMTGGNINGGAVSGYGSAIHLLADTLTTEQKACTVSLTGGTVTAKQDSARAAITIASNAHAVTVDGATVVGAGKAGSGGAAISGQGTAATIDIISGTVTGAASLSTDKSGVIYSRGIVNVTGGDIQVTEGDGPAVYMYQRYGLLTISGDASTSLSGRVRLVDNAKAASGYGVLKLVNGITDGMWYYTCSNAMDNYPADAFLRLFGSNAKLNFKSNTVYLDLNGHTCTVTNGSFYGFDSANDSYNASKCGKVTLDGAACLASATTAPNGNQYITATAEDGTLSFHRFDIRLPYVYLRTALKKEGIFYGSTVQMDQAAIDSLTTFGVALTTRELTTDAEWTENMDESVLRSTYELSELTASKVNEVRSTSLINIININNNTMENTVNAATTVYARPYLQLGDGTFVYGEAGGCTMEQVAEWADDRWSLLVESQKTGLLGMYERFSGVMNGWDMPNLKAAYVSGDADIDALILSYRRNLVLEAMREQHEILWTVDKEVTFSINSSSSGVDADLAVQQAKVNYDPLDDDIITFYPDRIYKSIPYTHGCGGNDALAAFATVDENGVYHIDAANPSLFNGGSTNGSATNGAYNVARIGNDCWDMVHFAWGKLTNSVTASQTRQMTPSFGVDIVGIDILEEAMADYVGNDGSTVENGLLECICDKSTASATKGYYIYKNLPDKDADGNTIAGNDVDGTRMVRYGTRTNIGTEQSPVYDYQAIYQTYAMLQPGDAMVRWRNSSGHAMMVVSVNVVETNGVIDGEKSTITILEQGSGNEERQSRTESEFDSTATANHSSHTGTNKNCMYCAGYTDQVVDGKHVWYLDLGEQERTFKEIAESDFIGVTCAALQEASAPSKVRVAVSNGGSGVAGLYTGTLASTYRVTQVTLTITGANGQVASETTCVGIQTGVSGPFDLNRFGTDADAGAYGSVLAGESVLYQETQTTTSENEDGTTTETTVTVQKADLPAGEYYYTYTCQLVTGHTLTLRSGSFDVAEDGTIQ